MILFIYCFSYNNIIGQRVVPSPKFRHRARESKCNNFVMQGHQIVTKTVIHKNNVKPAHFYRLFCLHINYMYYICNVFFMVLELRLTKIGCREDNQFFFVLTRPIFPDISHTIRFLPAQHRYIFYFLLLLQSLIQLIITYTP